MWLLILLLFILQRTLTSQGEGTYVCCVCCFQSNPVMWAMLTSPDTWRQEDSGRFPSADTKMVKCRAGHKNEVVWLKTTAGERRREWAVVGNFPRSPGVHSGRHLSCLWTQVKEGRWSGCGDVFSSILPLCSLPLLLVWNIKQGCCPSRTSPSQLSSYREQQGKG